MFEMEHECGGQRDSTEVQRQINTPHPTANHFVSHYVFIVLFMLMTPMRGVEYLYECFFKDLSCVL